MRQRNIDRLTKLANGFYRQAKNAANPMIRRALTNKGNRLRKKAEELERGGLQAGLSIHDQKIRQD